MNRHVRGAAPNLDVQPLLLFWAQTDPDTWDATGTDDTDPSNNVAERFQSAASALSLTAEHNAQKSNGADH